MCECTCGAPANFSIPVYDNRGRIILIEFRCETHLADGIKKRKASSIHKRKR